MNDDRVGLHEDAGTVRGLIIESEPVIAADISNALIRAGYGAPWIAGTEREAVLEFERSKPDFVLAEIQLIDGSSGIDAVEKILNIANVPVIFVTAFPERLLLAERVHPTYLITKPYQIERVIAAVDKSLTDHSSKQAPSADLRSFNRAIEDALLSLNKVKPSSSETVGDFGQNQPQSDSALTEDDYRSVGKALNSLMVANSNGTLSKSLLSETEFVLSRASEKILAWTRHHFSQVEEGFFNQLGASLADWKVLVATWLIVSGKIDMVLAAIHALRAHS